MGHVWFVDPEARTLEVYELTDKGYRVVDGYADDAVVRAVPFDALALHLAYLWAR